ncbi:MAG: RluA family pseudouridine synthase [Ruminococcaceae bacterium]|nr:RluA family pseudouridine synthase [Oscillospiraceae bacterium]
MRELQIGKNDAGQRLDKFITKALDIPMSLLYKSIRLKKIKVNRKRAEASMKLCEGDTVQCFLADEFFEKGKKNPLSEGSDLSADSLARVRAELDIIYEDENIILVNKPPGLSVHEDESTKSNTLITYIQSYLYDKGEYDPDAEQSFAPALCNRIDRNTQGIVIAAKNAESLRVMNEKIKLREINKFYLAAVHGIPKERTATLRGYLIKDEKTNTVRVFEKNPPRGAKEIITRYRTVAQKAGCALVEVDLLTGRTHQIRAHMAYIGHPLIGDGKYGKNKDDRARGYKHQALCSYKLRFSFEGEPTVLEYLNGKEFSIPKNEIYFTKEFF